MAEKDADNEKGKNEKKELTLRDRRDNPARALQREITSLIENFFNGSPLMPFGRFEESLRSFTPRVDITESPREIHISAELPGIKDEDVKVSVTNDVLTIEGEKKAESREDHKGYYRMERSYGKFSRAIRLPSYAEIDQASATFKEGVLTLAIPKRPDAPKSVKTIPVKKA